MILTSLAPRETPITPSAVDWYAPDSAWGGHTHSGLEIAGERVEDQ
jgi:hypothetical protein